MTLWIILTIMTSAVAVALSVPFIRRLDRPPVESAGDIEVYRDQLKEVESEQRQGLIDAAQAVAARLEIERHVLAADRMAQSAMPMLSGSERNLAVICVTGIVVLGSVGLYAATGNPDLPSARGSAATERAVSSYAQGAQAIERLAATMQTPASESQGQPRLQSGVPPVEEMIQRLATRLLQNPKDGEGWRTLGWSYLSVGRFSEASEAYAKAIELNPNVADIRSARVEALVRSADGIVTADAGNAIEATLKIDPGNARARFFKGLAKEQGGDKAGALTDWTAVLRDADPAEAWVPDLKSRISELERNLGANAAVPSTGLKPASPGGLLETPGAPGGSEMPSTVGKGPSAQDIQAAEIMPPAERSAMIRGMVDRLASRLEGSPRDADGWIKLIQSRMVLGETELAKQALTRGVEAFTDDARQRDRIVAAAQQLGLNQ
ncbi:c-type cytochrome biogenesis protein CcmI [Bradyrhizobium sediminis]|uniref:C-type cytochrome biogenesis protein CcmI n=1 Tax=Bradyrhizobium sediminis TaxID=2840469 RepID=A0A975RY01_9BRAD|nr:c-type cytochrome biogenesis protein CcmI [Bradyrhizobium sediminis]QWG24762.1 c-type cytochrome biogenesis protein CcmI [Bradyrhizobium sediminis]